MEKDSTFRALVAKLRELAANHPPDTRLPTTRELRQQYGVGPVTVQKAVAELARRGLVTTRPGAGTFTSRPSTAAAHADYSWQSLVLGPMPLDDDGADRNLTPSEPGVHVLSSGYLDEELQPTALLSQAASRAARRPSSWSRPPIEGIQELRQFFAHEIGVGVDPTHVLIAPGAQPALVTCFRSFAQPGDTVLVESPTYHGALLAARSAGLIPLGIPADSDGIRTDLLGEALVRTGARVIYAQPRWLNPSGSRLSDDRRRTLHELLAAHSAFLIEDDCAKDLDFGSSRPTPLVANDPHGHIVYIRSMTKHNGPGLRIAAMIARGPAAARLRSVRTMEGFFVSSLSQHVACEVLTSPTWERHLRRVRKELTVRRDVLIAALAREFPHWSLNVVPSCGVHLWYRLPEGSSEYSAVNEAARRGVLIASGRPYFPAEPSAPYVRLSYGGTSADELRRAVARLAHHGPRGH